MLPSWRLVAFVVVCALQHPCSGEAPQPCAGGECLAPRALPQIDPNSKEHHDSMAVDEFSKDKTHIHYNSIFENMEIFSLTSMKIDNDICRAHSVLYTQELKKYKLWAMQMFDATAKVSAGLLRGNAHQLGDMDQCLAVRGDVQGQYCLASLQLDSTVDAPEALRDAVDAVLAHRFITSTLDDPGHFVPRFTTINWGLCVPSSCRPRDIEVGLEEFLAPYNHSSGIEVQVRIEPEMCYTTDSDAWSPGTFLVLGMYALIIGMTVTATFKESPVPGGAHAAGSRNELLMAFSLRRTVAELCAELPSEGDISCIHGLRALFTAALYVAHKVIMLALVPYANRVELTKVSNQPLSMILRASVVYTDSFLLMSGVLTAFNMAKDIAKKKHIDWKSRYINRYLRLTPALLALVLFYGYVLEHVGHGPLWGRVISGNAKICRLHWWRNALYIQNMFPFEDMCATQTHQLALDVQLSLLAPLLVALLQHFPGAGWVSVAALHVVSTGARYISTLHHRLSLLIYHGMPVSQLYTTADHMYTSPLHRATPYLCGLSLGYLLFKTGKNVHIPRMVEACCWAGCLWMGHYSLLRFAGTANPGYRFNLQEAAVYATWAPVAWALALCWVVFACYTGRAGVIDRFLSSRPLVLFSRISYSVYLVQFPVFFYNVATTRTTSEFSVFGSISISEMAVVLVLSTFATLLFDLPMQEVKGIILRKLKASKEKITMFDKIKIPLKNN